MGVLDRKFLAANVDLPHRMAMNGMIRTRFVGKKMHVLGWARNVLSDVGNVSRVNEVHRTLFSNLGEPSEPELEAAPVVMTLRAQYADEHCRDFDVKIPPFLTQIVRD